MKGIYLGSYKAHHPNHDLDYNDIKQIVPHINIIGDMLTVDLSNYDFIIATPPCNYYSKARGNKKPSQYALDTKHLLPCLLNKLLKIGKPFIVENVRNKPLFEKVGIIPFNCFIYYHGRHTYWTNVQLCDLNLIPQKYDFKYGGVRLNDNTQGGQNVHDVIEEFIKKVKSDYN